MALYAVLSPMILARILEPVLYSAYAIGLQVIPFLLVLATPPQVYLRPKFAKYAGDSISDLAMSNLVSLAVRCFIFIALIAVLLALGLSVLLPVLLGWNAEFSSSAGMAIRYLGVAAALTIPAYAFTSYASGQQNFLWENFLRCSGSYIGLIVVYGVWKISSFLQINLSLKLIIILTSLSTILASIMTMFIGLIKMSAAGVDLSKKSKIQLRGIRDELGGVYWMQLCALLNMAAGPFIISIIDLKSVAAYSIAVSTMIVIVGVSTVFTGPFSVLISQSSKFGHERLVVVFKRFHDRFVLVVVLSTLGLVCIPQLIFDLWLGSGMGSSVAKLVLPLALANCARQLTSPYTTAVVGLGRQHRVWLSPLIEAVMSIILGLILGHIYGSLGVAYGLLVAALIRLLFTAFYDLKITRKELPLSARDLFIPRTLSFRGISDA